MMLSLTDVNMKLVFTVKNGEIVLWIQHAESILGEKCFVMLSYIDKENSETIRKHALDDL